MRAHTQITSHTHRYARDAIFYMGHDKHAFLEKAVKIGGESSLHTKMYDGLEVTKIPEEEMSQCELEHDAAELFALR